MKLDVYICACAILVSARNGAPSARSRPASCLRRQPIAHMHGQHPSGHGPDFVSAAGSRGPGIAEPAPAPPACQGRDARALKKHAHRPPPACASINSPLRSRVLISAVYARARARTKCNHAYGPHEFDFQSILRPGMCLFPGLPVLLTTRALEARGRAGPGGSCGKTALKLAGPPREFPPFSSVRYGHCGKNSQKAAFFPQQP